MEGIKQNFQLQIPENRALPLGVNCFINLKSFLFNRLPPEKRILLANYSKFYHRL